MTILLQLECTNNVKTMSTLAGEELVWLLRLPNAVKENGQVVVVVELLEVYFPLHLPAGTLESHLIHTVIVTLYTL